MIGASSVKSSMSVESLSGIYRRKQTENPSEWLKDTIACVLITTVCKRHCSLCCYKDIVHSTDAQHFPVNEILDEIRGLRNVGNVCISGGEPTLHPEIGRILALSREIRGESTLSLITNGSNLLEIAPATKYLNEVRFSLFCESAAESDVAEEYQNVKPPGVTLSLEYVKHHDTGGGLLPCDFLSYTLSVIHGRVYPCCAGAGITGAQFTDLKEGWEKRLLSVEAPCERCFNGA